MRTILFHLFARIILHGSQIKYDGKEAPTLKDLRFHSNNTSQSIKALERFQEKGIITKDDANLIDEYIVKRKADNESGSLPMIDKLSW